MSADCDGEQRVMQIPVRPAPAVGTHLIVDFYGASHLTDINYLEDAIRRAVRASQAVLLHVHLHSFAGAGGVTGVALLAESHISLHTWPESDYAAFDIFMCGEANPQAALVVLREALQPESEQVTCIERGESGPK